MLTARCAALFWLALTLPLAAQVPTPPTATARTTPRASKLLPGTKTNVLTTIQGNALTSTNGQLANAIVRLRDARSGRIVDSIVTDKAGLFAFRGVEPGSYLVEVLGQDESTVLTASQILTVDAGDVISAVVKLPFSLPPFAGVVGQSATTPSMAALAAQAASSGIVAVTSSGNVTCPIQ